MTNLGSILKSRDITLPTKVCLVKAMVFPVVMYECERRRIDAFELWCWRRLLRVPWTARRSNESILKEISPGCSLEWLVLKLRLQYFGYLMGRTDSFEKTLMLGKIEGRKGWQRMSWLCCRKGDALPGPETGLLSNTQKWIVRGDTCADKARDFIGKGHLGGEQ